MTQSKIVDRPWPEQKIAATDGNPQAWFGLTAALSDEMALVGAKNTSIDGRSYQGAVYVFVKAGGGWKQTQKIVASDGEAGDQFGTAVAILGNTAVISAPLAKIDGKTWQGAVYVFQLSGNTWIEKQKLIAKEGTAFDTFGVSIAITSSYLFIGSGGVFRAGEYQPRTVRIFKIVNGKKGNSWIENQTLDSPTPDDPTSFFGSSLAVSGNVALIGARASSINGNTGQGVVYVYGLSQNRWILKDQLVSDDASARDNFGNSIAMSGATALIGAPGAAINGNVSQGAVYQFTSTHGQWTQTQKFFADNGVYGALFGAALSLSNNSALIGAYGVNAYQGTSYIFQKKSGVWKQSEELDASDGVPGQVFGYFTALDRVTALVGAFGTNIDGNNEQGAAYMFGRFRLSSGS